MTHRHPLHLPEIQDLIGHHLDTSSLLAATLVCKDWCASFRPALWHTVISSSCSPDFGDPYAQKFLRHIRHLHVRIRLFDWPLPTYGFSRLTSLTISSVEDGYNANLWASLTEIVQNLAKQKANPLSSIELHAQPGPVEFWTALSTCLLKSLALMDLFVSEPKFPAFWQVCSTVESIHLRNTKAQAYGHPAEPVFRKRFFHLKHLTMEGDSALLWSGLNGQPALPWIQAPNLETVALRGEKHLHGSDLKNWVMDIEYANLAVDCGYTFYGHNGIEYDMIYEYYSAYEVPDDISDSAVTDKEDLDMEQYDSLVPGKKIHSFECRYPPLDYGGTMSVVIRNMELVQKVIINRLKSASIGLKSLTAHLETLVELDLLQCYLPSMMVVRFLEECPRLQVYIGDVVESGAVRESGPWACTGMRKFKVEFYSEKEVSEPLEFEREQENLLERLTRMPCLETFFMPEHFYKVGLDRLRGLTQVQDIWFPSRAYQKLTAADVEWMKQYWPQLKVVRAVSVGEIRRLPDVMNAFALLGVSLSYTYH